MTDPTLETTRQATAALAEAVGFQLRPNIAKALADVILDTRRHCERSSRIRVTPAGEYALVSLIERTAAELRGDLPSFIAEDAFEEGIAAATSLVAVALLYPVDRPNPDHTLFHQRAAKAVALAHLLHAWAADPEAGKAREAAAEAVHKQAVEEARLSGKVVTMDELRARMLGRLAG